MGRFLRENAFGLAILACAVVSFSFPSAFLTWGGVKLTKFVTPAIQVIMFGMVTNTYSLIDGILFGSDYPYESFLGVCPHKTHCQITERTYVNSPNERTSINRTPLT